MTYDQLSGAINGFVDLLVKSYHDIETKLYEEAEKRVTGPPLEREQKAALLRTIRLRFATAILKEAMHDG